MTTHLLNIAASAAFALVIILVIAVAAKITWRAYHQDPDELETARRRWVAVSPSGNVVLGLMIDYTEALQRASRLGTVAFTDMERGYIFFNVTEGTNGPPATF